MTQAETDNFIHVLINLATESDQGKMRAMTFSPGFFQRYRYPSESTNHGNLILGLHRHAIKKKDNSKTIQ